MNKSCEVRACENKGLVRAAVPGEDGVRRGLVVCAACAADLRPFLTGLAVVR